MPCQYKNSTQPKCQFDVSERALYKADSQEFWCIFHLPFSAQGPSIKPKSTWTPDRVTKFNEKVFERLETGVTNDTINLTGSSLTGADGTEIAVGNFYVNTSDANAGQGQQMVAGPITLRSEVQSATDGSENATLLHGSSAALDDYGSDITLQHRGNLSVFFWVDVPSSANSQEYNATWNITVFDLI